MYLSDLSPRDKFSNLILKIEVWERKKRNTYKKRKTKARSYNN